MRFVRYDDGGTARLGLVRGEAIVTLAPIADRYPTMLSIIEGGDTALAAARGVLDTGADALALKDAKLLAPIERPSKFMAIGMNYAKHLEEADRLGVPRAANQVWFNKQTTCIAGPYDAIDPGVTEKLDYEVELGVVIGKSAKKVGQADAKGYVFGYFVMNDVSARDWQWHSNTMTMGKSFDTHGPMGPWIVTADEVPDPHALDLRCYVNGELRQSNNTGGMIANVWSQISYLSTAFTLLPGDLIATGTPEGVAAAMENPVFLKPGDVVRCEIDGIGAIENKVIAPA
ncbi:2-keto-4-pentenoate hydratase/2-oxohepta-3-ene-1,7-dioic acid hydratase in catechol pathway [Sphingobium fontiphilum]|uniref:2-keto-4-pentenoate hydratase/2-oxohepta-3-ene-1,7-dioic acid hydratase in catechol pathway n=1 Tax=Sphingobium fontiphilum TaxID=944425 RepID=A0A7W6GNF0_9SPHN|nr:fumarylacetoacetate hydrolase family protein [Sphingobium fontiphilum]MBB3982246.1 2-keto-4-pentenoate hydratase/2-oxohepta-3-ene-1,7-dioic acid hydratase in catechol pathway [Sphingobium fontiphilum]